MSSGSTHDSTSLRFVCRRRTRTLSSSLALSFLVLSVSPTSALAQPGLPIFARVEDQYVITPSPGHPLSQDGAILIAGSPPEGVHYELSWGGPAIRLRVRSIGTSTTQLTHLEPTMPLHPGTPYVLWKKTSNESTELQRFQTTRTRASIAKQPERSSIEGGTLLRFDPLRSAYVVIAMQDGELQVLTEPLGDVHVPCELGSFVVFDSHGRLVQPLREPDDACPETTTPLVEPPTSDGREDTRASAEGHAGNAATSCDCHVSRSSGHEPLGISLSLLAIALLVRRRS